GEVPGWTRSANAKRQGSNGVGRAEARDPRHIRENPRGGARQLLPLLQAEPPGIGHERRPRLCALRSPGDLVTEPVDFDEIVVDELTANEMFLDDPLEHRWIAGSIPGTLGIDNRDRSAFANPEAVRFRAQDAPLLGEPEFLQPAFQIIPRLETTRFLAAFRRG